MFVSINTAPKCGHDCTSKPGYGEVEHIRTNEHILRQSNVAIIPTRANQIYLCIVITVLISRAVIFHVRRSMRGIYDK